MIQEIAFRVMFVIEAAFTLRRWRPLGMPCAVREALAPAVRARYNRHICGIMIQEIMFQDIFVIEAISAPRRWRPRGRRYGPFVIAVAFIDMNILLLRHCSQTVTIIPS